MSDAIHRDAAFLNRFRMLTSRKRSVQLWHVAASSSLLAIVGLAVLTMADYSLELNRGTRVVALGALLAAVAAYLVVSLWRTTQRWGQSMTAAEIEQAFPELGQSVRTTVQFGTLQIEQVQSAGVAKSLVAALAEQTHQRALPLTIEDVIPSGKLRRIAFGLVAGIALLAGASRVDWQWRNATERAMLKESPYRELAVRPGDLTVEEGEGLTIDVALIGRTDREVVLLVRPADREDQAWTERKLDPVRPDEKDQLAEHPGGIDPVASGVSDRPSAGFVARLERLARPLEYRVSAGELVSPVYYIDIRRPLRLSEAKVELTPPAYTGHPTSTWLDLNLTALQGTAAKFDIQFDKAVKSAELILMPSRQSLEEGDRQPPEVAPLTLHHDRQSASRNEGADEATASASVASVRQTSAAERSRREGATVTRGTVELTLNEDRTYTLAAEAEDGTRLQETRYRIRVREDQPPEVFIEEPNDAVEVHALAEIFLRILVRDDYGLSKAGIVFQINNEQEVPLVKEDFPAVVKADEELQQTGQMAPTTRAALEKILPLEFFELTQKDSVTYFAFAEDNRPDRPQRTETDLRYIDIRPFKRTYRVVDPDPMPGTGAGLKTLEELIRRQRFALNRTLQIEKRAAAGRTPDAATLDQLMQFETELAQNVRDSAQGLEARGFDDTELFYQAEAAMLQAVDSLSVGKWENASLQMRDALKFLIEQRDRTQTFLFKNPDAARLAALRQFDRMQAQKLRRPKTDKEEARELIRRLEELADQEAAITKALADHGDPPEVVPTDRESN